MDRRKLESILTNINGNISLLKEILQTKDSQLIDHPKRIERAKYFFVSATQTLLNISNEYIEINNWRTPINAMDVFIVLSENELISKNQVPNLKKAVTSASTISRLPYNDALNILRECVTSLEHCISAYKVLIQTGEL